VGIARKHILKEEKLYGKLTESFEACGEETARIAYRPAVVVSEVHPLYRGKEVKQCL
jgi:hypothetical protein